MKVVIKKPNEGMKIIEVSDLAEINKLTGNVDENGDGLSDTGSDGRESVFPGIDMYMKEDAIFNVDLEKNFWDARGTELICGNVIFAGYDPKCRNPYGVCSLKDEQIEYLKNNIRKQFDIF